MTYAPARRGRPVVAAALALLLVLLLAAPQARADGEDDPTFGNLGTSFIGLGEDVGLLGDPDSPSSSPMQPRTDQGPDGGVYAAVPLQDHSGRGGDEFVRLVRMDGSGKAAGLDGDGMVDVDYGNLRNLLDIEVLGDGSIIVVTQSDSFDSRGSTPPVEIRTFNASGGEIDSRQFPFPDLCGYNNARARAADVDPQGRVFVGWDNCEDQKSEEELPAVLARYDGDSEDTAQMLVGNVEKLVLGPQSRVYALSFEDFFFSPGGQRSVVEATVVTRYDTEDVEPDTDYGDEGRAEIPGSLPVDLSVDPNGRAVVWTETFSFAGRGPEEETWDIYRFDSAGVLDESWGDEGHAAISHPEIGRTSQCFRLVRGGFNCAEQAQLIAQGDGKVVAIGYPPREQEPERGGDPDRPDTDRTIIRLTTAGALDPAWGGDGVRGFQITQPPDGTATYDVLGPPTLQSDGKLLIPIFTFARENNARIPAPPFGEAFGVSRIGLSPPAPPAPPVTTAQQQQAAALAAARTCVSRRVFRIRLRTGRRKAERSAIKTVRVTVNGKNVPVTKGQRRRAQVDLRNLPKGRFTVIIRMTLADGGKVRDTRRYRTCTPKRARALPGLRTRKPRRR